MAAQDLAWGVALKASPERLICGCRTLRLEGLHGRKAPLGPSCMRESSGVRSEREPGAGRPIGEKYLKYCGGFGEQPLFGS